MKEKDCVANPYLHFFVRKLACYQSMALHEVLYRIFRWILLPPPLLAKQRTLGSCFWRDSLKRLRKWVCSRRRLRRRALRCRSIGARTPIPIWVIPIPMPVKTRRVSHLFLNHEIVINPKKHNISEFACYTVLVFFFVMFLCCAWLEPGVDTNPQYCLLHLYL